MSLKISLITAVLNRADTLEKALKSILQQTYSEIECIVVDGGSTDGSLDIIKKYEKLFNGRLKWISEPDKGLYDALNKGLKLATGEIVGFINSDDYYNTDNIIEYIAEIFEKEDIQAVYGDVHYVSRTNPDKITRYYSSSKFKPSSFRYGFMPAHPTFFTYLKYYKEWGYYKTDYKISGDFELTLRFLYGHKMKYKYINLDFITMRTGGLSTASIHNIITINKEQLRACRENGVKSNYILQCSRYLVKIFQWKLFPKTKKSNDKK